MALVILHVTLALTLFLVLLDSCEGGCTDPVWCNVPMPKLSHFRFMPPPTDEKRWRLAQQVAASGRQVFTERALKAFPYPDNFLDGDTGFKNIENMVDVFLDPKTMLGPLANGKISSTSKKRYARMVTKDGDEGKKEERYIRPGYVNSYTERAPITQIGAFKYEGKRIVTAKGNAVRGISHKEFLAEFEEVEEALVTPAIYMCSLNENWGFFSSAFPDRTMQWGRYPKNKAQRQTLETFLNSDKTVMMIINQHSNFSHPKLLVLPRGIPLTWGYTNKIVWDSMHFVVANEVKTQLLASMASDWGPRPRIIKCISEKIPVDEFFGHSDSTVKRAVGKPGANAEEKRSAYYVQLARARFGLMVPGMGYDCFRNWEMLLLGSIGVIERGIGFDRSYWRLPVLLVDDFFDVTVDLLRSAYVQAIYDIDQFEFERLQQSYWYGVIYNVSQAKDAAPMLDKFPMLAETPRFVRPFQPFHCGDSNELCGEPGIKTPKQSC